MKITIYTIPECQFSKTEKEYFASKNIQFEEKNLEANREYSTEMLTVSNNFAGTPVTKIEKDDGQIVVLKGFTKEEFDKELSLSATPAEVKPDVAAEAPKVESAPAVAPVIAAVAPAAVPTIDIPSVPPAPFAAAPVSPTIDIPSVPAQTSQSVPSIEIPDMGMPSAPDIVPSTQNSNVVTPDLQANFPPPASVTPTQDVGYDPNAFNPPSVQPQPIEQTPEPGDKPLDQNNLSSILDSLQSKVNNTPNQSQGVGVPPAQNPPTNQ